MSVTGGTHKTTSPISVAKPLDPLARWGPRTRRRGWAMRRMLLLADLTGLCLAYTISRVAFPPTGQSSSTELWKALVFVATLPLWILIAKLLGLYNSDDERTDHTT